MNENFDATRLTLLLNELRLPATKQMWSTFAEQSDKEGWPAARLLTVLAENELTERNRRRIERHLAEAKLLAGKTLDNFDFNSVPMVSKAQVMALCAGDEWLRNGANVLLLGPPGGGKSHLSSAIGLALLEKGWRVLFARTSPGQLRDPEERRRSQARRQSTVTLNRPATIKCPAPSASRVTVPIQIDAPQVAGACLTGSPGGLLLTSMQLRSRVAS